MEDNILKKAFINEIKFYIENEKEYDSVKNNDLGVLDYLNSLKDDDILEIADRIINDDYFNEILNETISEHLYKYKKWEKNPIDRKKDFLLYATKKNDLIIEIFINNENYYLLSINGQFIKKYKNKDKLYNYIRINYDVICIF